MGTVLQIRTNRIWSKLNNIGAKGLGGGTYSGDKEMFQT